MVSVDPVKSHHIPTSCRHCICADCTYLEKKQFLGVGGMGAKTTTRSSKMYTKHSSLYTVPNCTAWHRVAVPVNCTYVNLVVCILTSRPSITCSSAHVDVRGRKLDWKLSSNEILYLHCRKLRKVIFETSFY